MATQTANLNLLVSTGLPIYISEFDVDGPTDEVQLADYQRIFPTFWLHPAVRGITLWGWRPGMFRPTAFLVQSNGFERPAMIWLKEFVRAPTGTLLVCHEDKTIRISKHAVPDHLGHGDFLGNCK